MASRASRTSLLSTTLKLLAAAACNLLMGCSVEAVETIDGEALAASTYAHATQKPRLASAAAHECRPEDHVKRCKRDKDCPRAHYCDDSGHGEDDQQGQGHQKHDHQHGGKRGICRPRDSDDGNPCTNDAVDSNGAVTHVAAPAGTSCEDGNACNGNETCSGQAQCRPGTAPALSDDNPCTLDSCDPAFGV